MEVGQQVHNHLEAQEGRAMIECVILLRNTTSGVVMCIEDDDGIAVFKNHDEAVACADSQIMCQAFPYQIVELDEL